MAIIVFVAIFVVLACTLTLLYNYFNTVFKFRDYDETIYYVKKVGDTFGMYDENGNMLTTTVPPGTTEKLYVTKIGTMVDVDPETGDAEIRAIPDLYYMDDGEGLNAIDAIVVFPSIETGDVKSIEIKNPYGEYTIAATTNSSTGSKYFVVAEAPFIATKDSAMSYVTYNAAHVIANDRFTGVKDLSEYGLAEETRIDEDGNLYEYTPSYYILTTNSGEKHKIIIGDMLVDGSGYYIQYENGKGQRRPAVYVLTPTDVSSVDALMTYESTIMGPAKNYLTPSLIYTDSSNTFYEVENFTVSQKQEDGKEYNDLISFSYSDIADRTGTVLGSHPYVFDKTSFTSYNPNHDNIDMMLKNLIEPNIVDIAAIDPTDAEKAKFGLMSIKVDENGDPILDKHGNIQYYYDSEYMLKFNKYITMDVKDSNGNVKSEKFKITQKIYISAKNENGNYYTFTLITMPDATAKGMIESVNINIINEVSESTLGFLHWNSYNWVYPTFMQMGISYLEELDITYGDYSVNFTLDHGSEGSLNTLGVNATDSKGQSTSTFSILTFTDREGYYWIITPQRIYVYDASGAEVKNIPARHYEYNSIDEQVQVLDGYRTDANGNKVYVYKDKIVIVRANGKTEEKLRYHTMLFRKVFSNIITMRLVDSYVVSDEEIKEIVKDDNLFCTIKITDNEGTLKTCKFYNITSRKAYVVVDGQGGFYVQTTKLQKLMDDIAKFYAGQDIKMEGLA